MARWRAAARPALIKRDSRLQVDRMQFNGHGPLIPGCSQWN